MAAAGALLLGACGSGDGSAAADPPPEAVAGVEPVPGVEAAELALDQERSVIDVRTPEEHAEGHVEGTALLDARADDFDARVADLDPDESYVVYCRTGNRSAAAVETMRAEGLDVVDGGAMDDMVTAGWPTTT
jgi:phage shock protein E